MNNYDVKNKYAIVSWTVEDIMKYMKYETNWIGSKIKSAYAERWLENNSSNIQKEMRQAGELFIQELINQEASDGTL